MSFFARTPNRREAARRRLGLPGPGDLGAEVGPRPSQAPPPGRRSLPLPPAPTVGCAGKWAWPEAVTRTCPSAGDVTERRPGRWLSGRREWLGRWFPALGPSPEAGAGTGGGERGGFPSEEVSGQAERGESYSSLVSFSARPILRSRACATRRSLCGYALFCERSSGLSYPPRQQGEGASRQKLIGSFLAAVILCEGGASCPHSLQTEGRGGGGGRTLRLPGPLELAPTPAPPPRWR